ncbi:MAG: glycosyltransferase involved in cell wall biosynthesis [Planctomycetota bacterium]
MEHGVSGFIENPFDVEAFSERIAELLRDPERAAAMGQAGRERLEERFQVARLTEECLEEYELARVASRA